MNTYRREPLWRLMQRVDTTGDCWLWRGAVSSTGYPVFNPAPGEKTYAARWLHGALNGMASGRVSMTCGNKLCVRPSHVTMRTKEDRFWSQVEVDAGTGCWLWRGHTVGRYGRFDMVLAHRFAYEAMVASIPDGLTLDHLCMTPPCVNPDHLDPVPQSVNASRWNAHNRLLSAATESTTP